MWPGSRVVAVSLAVRGSAPPSSADATLLNVFFVALALSVMINIALVLIALYPLRALERVAADVWKGNTGARVPPSILADRDIARVGHTLDLLVAKLVEYRARSHDLAAYVISQAEAEQARIAYHLHESAAQPLAAQLRTLAHTMTRWPDLSAEDDAYQADGLEHAGVPSAEEPRS